MSAPRLETGRVRIEQLLGRTLAALPASLQRRLAGGGPVVVDGLTLAPELQVILAARRWTGAPGLTTLSPVEGRRRMRRDALVGAGKPDAVGAVRDLAVAGAVGSLAARHYSPQGPSASGSPSSGAGTPLIVFYHGGGFVFGDVDTHDAPCRTLCAQAGVQVLSIAYRLAPEHPFPAAVDDAVAAFAWAVANAAALGADATRIAVAGDSAGANLAAVVAQETVRRRRPAPALQLLVYPALDQGRATRSLSLFADGYVLTRADVHRFEAHYVGGTGTDPRDPRLSPLAAPAADLVGLPPAIVATAGFDPLRDEGEDYAARLGAAGTRTLLRRFDGLVHGFMNMIGLSPACRAATVGLARDARVMLSTVRASR